MLYKNHFDALTHRPEKQILPAEKDPHLQAGEQNDTYRTAGELEAANAGDALEQFRGWILLRFTKVI